MSPVEENSVLAFFADTVVGATLGYATIGHEPVAVRPILEYWLSLTEWPQHLKQDATLLVEAVEEALGTTPNVQEALEKAATDLESIENSPAPVLRWALRCWNPITNNP